MESEVTSDEEEEDEEIIDFPSQNRKRNLHTAYASTEDSIIEKKKKKTATVRPLRIEDDDSD